MFFWVFRDAAGEWRWTLHRLGNNKKMGTSGEGYTRRIDCEAAIAEIRHFVPSAPIRYAQQ